MAQDNWLTRSRGAGGTLVRRDEYDPWPTAEQTSLPSDYNVHLQEPGFTLGHVVPDARRVHKLDGQNGIGAAARSLLQRIFSKIGLHGQTLTNFRVGVGINEATALPYNPGRSYLFILNTGTNTIFVAFDRNADANTGILIPAGGFFEPILGTMSSVHLVSLAVNQQCVIVEGFYGFPGV